MAILKRKSKKIGRMIFFESEKIMKHLNKNVKRIILEFTPEEVKLLAYGAIPRSVKERLTEIACHIDDTEWTIAVFKEKEREKKNFEKQKKKQPVNDFTPHV